VREAIMAGIFYPDDGTVLMEAVDDALRNAAVAKGDAAGNLAGNAASAWPMAILSPHAAFAYSGAVQGAAWASSKGRQIDRIVILAPIRRTGETAAYLPEATVFQTPIGDVEVDTGACADLESCSTLFSSNDLPHLESHAIEVQLPFMRRLFPHALLVPILVGGDARVAEIVSRAVDVVFGDDMERVLVVASSNLASSMIAVDAERRSDELLVSIMAGDWRLVAEHRETIGAVVIAATMALRSMTGARGRLLARLDSRGHSGSALERIVHYGALAWYEGAIS
jgi:hypothetical protein